jgi:NitT/TauT family transport system substrate-binding protein
MGGINLNNKYIHLCVLSLCFTLACLAGKSGAAQARETPIPVTVQLGDVSLTKLPVLLAADNGIFARNGLKVDIFISPSAAAVVRAEGVNVPAQNIRSGVVADIDIGGGSPMVVNMTTVATYPHRIIIATMDNVVRFHIIARKGITSVDQLKGKRIGYEEPGSLDQYGLLLFFHKMGWDPVNDVSMYSNGGSVGNIVSGQVDAMAGSEIAIAEAKKLGLNDLVDLKQYNWAMPGSGVMALSGWAKQNPDACARFIKSMVEAIALMKTDKRADYASLKKWFGMTDPAKLAAVYASAKNLPSKPYPSIAGLRMMHTVYDWRAFDTSKPEDFADSSYVAALDKSGFIDSLYKTKQ